MSKLMFNLRLCEVVRVYKKNDEYYLYYERGTAILEHMENFVNPPPPCNDNRLEPSKFKTWEQLCNILV